jgi:hypothetical protein
VLPNILLRATGHAVEAAVQMINRQAEVVADIRQLPVLPFQRDFGWLLPELMKRSCQIAPTSLRYGLILPTQAACGGAQCGKPATNQCHEEGISQ